MNEDLLLDKLCQNYTEDDSAVYRKNDEYLIVRIDSGIEKIVTYGVN